MPVNTNLHGHNFWKLEWRDFVVSSQLLCIFIEGKIKAIQLVNARVNVQTVLLSFFSVFIFPVPSKAILPVIEFMFLGINMFWALLGLILALTERIRLTRVWVELGPKHIYAREHKLYCYVEQLSFDRKNFLIYFLSTAIMSSELTSSVAIHLVWRR